jgi:hypothetical protein
MGSRIPVQTKALFTARSPEKTVSEREQATDIAHHGKDEAQEQLDGE